MKDPRPRITSARPPDIASSVEKRWNRPHRIIRRQHGDRRAQPEAAVWPAKCGQHHIGRGNREIIAVMFAEAHENKAHLIGQHGFGDHVPQHLMLGKQRAVRADVTSPNVIKAIRWAWRVSILSGPHIGEPLPACPVRPSHRRRAKAADLAPRNPSARRASAFAAATKGASSSAIVGSIAAVRTRPRSHFQIRFARSACPDPARDIPGLVVAPVADEGW